MYITSIERSEWANWIEKRNTPIRAALKFAGVASPSAVERVMQGAHINLETKTVEKIRAAIASETPALDRISDLSDTPAESLTTANSGNGNGNGTGYYRDPRWLKLRDQCLERHPHCFACGKSTDRLLQVHHIRYNRSTDGLPYWLVPIGDLTTVCVEHHDEIHAGLRDLRKTLSLIPHYPEIFPAINRVAKEIAEVIQDCRKRHSAPVIDYNIGNKGNDIDFKEGKSLIKQEIQSWSSSRAKQ